MRRCATIPLVLLGLACGREASAPAEASRPVPADGAVKEPAAGGPGTPEAGTPTPTPAEVAAPSSPPADEWLLWHDSGEGWRTRWLSLVGDEPTVVAESDALVVSDGSKLWRLDFSDRSVKVVACECYEEEEGSEYRPKSCDDAAERIDVPELTAVELVGEARTPLVTADAFPLIDDVMVGDADELAISVVGGVGARVFLEVGVSGYFCGAHGLYESSFDVHALVPSWPAVDLGGIGKALPEPLRRDAAEQMLPDLRDCNEDPSLSLETVMRDEQELDAVSVFLDGGRPMVTWDFTAFLPYVCSPDYSAHGQVRSELLEAAAPLGLAPTLPEGLRAAMREIAGDGTVGWADLTLEGEARDTALERFRTATMSVDVGEPGPPEAEPEAAPTPGTKSPAGTTAAVDPKKALAQARKATRDGDHAGAIALLDEALAADPGLARAWSSRGYAKLLSGDLAGAEKDFRTALKKKKGDDKFAAAVHFNLGQLEEKRGNATAAEAAYRKSLALRETSQARAALDGLKP